jgi:hypothetical protein
MAMLNPFGGTSPFNFSFDPMAAQNMAEAGSLAQLALRSPEQTAGLLAAQGIPPPAVAKSDAKIGALVGTDKTAGTGTGAPAPSSIETFTKALSALQPEPTQAALQPPGAIAPSQGKQIDSGNVMRMLQLLNASNGAAAGRTPSIGALIAGR